MTGKEPVTKRQQVTLNKFDCKLSPVIRLNSLRSETRYGSTHTPNPPAPNRLHLRQQDLSRRR